MFAAACDKIVTETLSREGLSVEDKVRAAVRGVLMLMDVGDADLGIPLMTVHPDIQDTIGELGDDEVDFRIPSKDTDIAGQLHEFIADPEALADGHQLRSEFKENLGRFLATFNNTLGDLTDVG